MLIWFLVWVITTQGVNLAFYLAITQAVHGWVRTVGAYVAGYLLPLAGCLLLLNGRVHGGERGMVGSFPLGFLAFFVLWGVLTLAMSRGAVGRRLFAVLVCGVHQVGAFVFSFVLMRRLPSVALGEIAATAVMGGMGAMLLLRVIPRVLAMDAAAGWRELNLTAVMNLTLLYATGVWPSYAAAGDWRSIAMFVVANIVAVVYFPVGLAFAEKNREVRIRRMLEDNTRVLQAELKAVRAAEDGARRVRHDARHHVGVLCEYLEAGRGKEALTYLRETLSHELLLPPSNVRWCENMLVNTILTVGSRRAAAKGLTFRAEARVSEFLKIREPDLVALLSNLIENSINGSVGGTVRVSVMEDRGALRIGVSNMVPSGFELHGGLPCERPGVGMISVREVVEKYHGLFDYELRNGELTARVMIAGVA